MVDLAQIAERAYFHPATKARTSIKKVLPAVLSTSTYLREKYQKPVYGITIPSKNFEKFTWWKMENETLLDPYGQLGSLTQEMLDDISDNSVDSEVLDVDIQIAEGGAAAMAFARLQFENLSAESRNKIKDALLRYCELDTLAVVMISEAWQAWAFPGRLKSIEVSQSI